MHRSHWDLEVYAKDFQENRWREAARQRLAAEAAGGQAPENRRVWLFHLDVARGVAVVQSWFSAPRLASERADAGEAAVADETRGVPRSAPSARLASPYDAMAVIARGSAASIAEQPSGVSDC